MLPTGVQLINFVNLWNEGFLQIDKQTIGNRIQSYLDDVGDSFNRQFCLSYSTRTAIGLSEVGKPAVILALKHLSYKHNWGIKVEREEIKTSLRFHFGDVFESLILRLLEAYGFHIDKEQHEVSYANITGHIDCVIGEDTVLEIKTMSDTYFRKFLKAPDDARGYLTQLNMYSHLLGLKGAWLCLNKQTNELAYVPLVPSTAVIDRAKNVINYVNDLMIFQDIFKYFQAPDAEPEYFKKQPTGQYILPESMRYCNLAEVFYDLEERLNGYKKHTKYVTGYKDEDVAYEQLRDILGKPF